jgi:hypothetical protein
MESIELQRMGVRASTLAYWSTFAGMLVWGGEVTLVGRAVAVVFVFSAMSHAQRALAL